MKKWRLITALLEHTLPVRAKWSMSHETINSTSTHFYQYLQRLWIFLLSTSSPISTPRPQPACLTQYYRDIQLKVELGQSRSGSMVSVGKHVVVSDALKDTFVELKILKTVSRGSRFFALSIGYTTIKKWHIGLPFLPS